MSEEKKLSETVEIPVAEFAILFDFARRFNAEQTVKHAGPLAMLLGNEAIEEMINEATQMLTPVSFEIQKLNSEELKKISNDHLTKKAEEVQKKVEGILKEDEQQPTTERPADKKN